MLEIFDIHTHILPGLDDGSGSLNETLQMLKSAESQGIRHLIATPHYSRMFPNRCPERIRSLCEKIGKKAEEKGITTRIFHGQEILYGEDIPELLAAGEVLTLAGSRYVLIEFRVDSMYMDILRAVQTITMSGFRPVIAHVERYMDLRDLSRMEALLGQGAYMQMNFRSAAKGGFDKHSRWCRKLLKLKMIHFMGTDMHNMGGRRPETNGTVSWLERHLDRDYVEHLLKGNAQKLLLDEKIRWKKG